MKRVVTLTINPTIDINSSVQIVMPEKKLRCDAPTREPGGGGINVSRAMQKLGGQSIAMYTSGGHIGEMLTDLLREEGIERHPIEIEGWTRENFIAFERDTSQQFRFGMPGPEIQEREWKSCLEALERIEPKPEIVVASGSIPPGVPKEYSSQLANIVKQIGARLILDTSQEALREAIQQHVFLIKPNLRELRELAGTDLPHEEDQEAYTRELVQQGKCEVIVLSLGAAGVMMVTKEKCKRMRAPTVPIKSKVGAGDSTVAGITLALARGENITEAVRFGIAAGSAAVMTPGTELCRRDDTERLYRQMKEQAES